LGPDAINGALNGGDCHEEGNGAAQDNTAPEPEGIKDVENEPSNKRQKTSDGEPASEP